MTRERKYKAWDKRTNTMYIVEGLYFDIEGNLHSVDVVTEDPRGMYLELEWGVDVIEYIGLKDKNDVEIYEGNIIPINYGEVGEFHNAKVVFSMGGFALKIGSMVVNYVGHWSQSELEVIGNIFENPELLEE